MMVSGMDMDPEGEFGAWVKEAQRKSVVGSAEWRWQAFG